MEKLVDTSRFILKSRAVKLALAKAGAREILKGAQEIYDAADKNLSGPHYKPGQPHKATMPIARITGNLSNSLKLTPLSSTVVAVWSDPKIANYNRYVHDGTKGKKGKRKRMKPRRFIGAPVNERRPAIQGRIRRQVLLAIRKDGRT